MTGARPGPRLLADTALLLARAWVELRVRPFAAVMARLPRNPAPRPCPAAVAARLGRALDAWERRVPWRWKCFEKGLAAAWWLDRRGYAYTLHYGARGQAPLEAHVWITSGPVPVVGCDHADRFAELKRFSNAAPVVSDG